MAGGSCFESKGGAGRATPKTTAFTREEERRRGELGRYMMDEGERARVGQPLDGMFRSAIDRLAIRAASTRRPMFEHG